MPLNQVKADAVLNKVRNLRKHTQQTGFRTTRSQNDLLAQLNAEELAYVVAQLI